MANKKRVNPFSGNFRDTDSENPSDTFGKMSWKELMEELHKMEKSLGKENFRRCLNDCLDQIGDEMAASDLSATKDGLYDSDIVTVSEWRSTHPEFLNCGSDQYYADLANALCDIINEFELPPNAPENLARESGIVLAAYLEDLVSGTKVFSAMRRVCMQRYGYTLPFYDCCHQDYMPDHINEEDIRFLIWATACRLGKDIDVTYSPLAMGWQLMAERIFDELNERYEEAPEARRVTDWLRVALRKEDYLKIREVAKWLVLHCPLSYMPGYLDEIYDSIQQMAFDEDIEPHNVEQITYGMLARCSWQRSMSVMGCSSQTLVGALAAEFGYDSLAEDIENIEVLPLQMYALSKDKKTGKIIFETSTYERLEVARDSFAKGFRPEEIKYAQCNLLRFKGQYLLNGMLSGEPAMRNKWENQPSLFTFEQQRAQVKEWVEILDGKQVVCVTRIQTLLNKLGFPTGDSRDVEKAKNYVALLSYELGLALLPDMGYAFDLPDNRFFRKRKAAKDSFPELIFNNAIPHDVAVYIEKNRLLPEACIRASQGKDTGRKIVQDYLAFWIGFYRQLPPYGGSPSSYLDEDTE